RVSVWSQAHYLVLVQVHVEPEIQRENAVQYSERVGRSDLLHQFDLVSASDCDRGALLLAHTIGDNDERLLEATRVEGAGGMCEVMRDGHEFPAPIDSGEVLVEQSDLSFGRIDLVVLRLCRVGP